MRWDQIPTQLYFYWTVSSNDIRDNKARLRPDYNTDYDQDRYQRHPEKKKMKRLITSREWDLGEGATKMEHNKKIINSLT